MSTHLIKKMCAFFVPTKKVVITYLQIYLAYVFEITKHKNTEFFIKQKKTITFEI